MKKIIAIIFALSLILFSSEKKSIAIDCDNEWALALCAILIEYNHERHDLLAGNEITGINISLSKKSLDDWWGIKSKEDLYYCLDLLDSGRHRKIFDKFASIISVLSEDEYKKLFTSIQDKNDRYRLTVVSKYRTKVGTKSILAWDYCRYIYLCRKSYMCGYITEEEAWKLIMPVARKLQQKFESWNDLGENYLIGREFWDEEIFKKEGKIFRKIYENLLIDKKSPWTRIPWKTNFKPTYEKNKIYKTEKLSVKKTDDFSPKSILNDNDFNNWLKYYYLHKNASLAPGAIKFIRNFYRDKNNESFMPTYATFFSEVFKENKDKLSIWIEDLDEFSFEEMMYYYYLPLYWSETQEGINVILKDYHKYNETQKSVLLNLLFSNIPDLDEIEINDAVYLDMLWTKFFVRGNKKPIQRIISVLPNLKGNSRDTLKEIPEKDLFPIIIALSAQWSLISNGISNKEVFEIIQEEYRSTQNKEIKNELEIIIEEIEKTAESQKSKDKAYVLFQKSISLNKNNKHEEALSVINEAIELVPNFHEMWLYKGAIYFKLNQNEKALECFEKSLTLKDNDTNAWLFKGMALKKLNRPDEAIQSFDKSLQFDQKNADAYFNKADIYLEVLHDYEKAIKLYEKGLEIKPDFDFGWYQKAIALGNIKEFEKSIESINKATELNKNDASYWNFAGRVYAELKRFEEALTFFNNAIELKTDYEEAWYFKAKIYKELNNYKEALACYDKVLDINRKSFDAWLDKGDIYLKANEFENALTAYDKCIELNPDYAYSFSAKGIILSKLEKFDDAIKSFNRSLELNPKEAMAWINLGATYTQINQYNNALHAYSKAVELKPDFIEGLRRKSDILFVLNRDKEGFDLLDNALKLSPDNFDLLFSKGSALLQNNNYKEALLLFDKCIQLNPTDPFVWFQKGYTFYKLNNFLEALQSYDRAIKLKPDFIDAWNNKSFVLCELKEYDQALAVIDKTLEFNPNLPDACYNKVFVLCKLNQYKKANSAYSKIVELGDAITFYDNIMLLTEMEKYNEALNLLNKKFDNNMKNYNDLYLKGMVLAQMEQYENALISINEAIALDETDIRCWIIKGYALDQLNKFDESLHAYNKALSINPNSTETLYNRACLFARNKDTMNSTKDLSKAFKINPGLKKEAKKDNDLKILWKNNLLK